ncbi:MAG: hypothetical protein Q3M24_22630 [Candidatus Electrothrix aestuarii]|uniref:DUF4430 domain-containing protein n=1 Tax=Candidatus Electrothrix aestuarii TaxID=3062594 RepID=A0AAU8LVX8_9BACT|nr:hypothetical protein [Candidatus Electrothrix aestuarii]
MKSIWITALAKEQVSVMAITGTASQYGLAADGHFWTDDLGKMAWLGIREKLTDKNISLWVIAGKAEDLTPEVRYGLTLLSLTIRMERPDLSLLWVDTEDDKDKSDNSMLPTVFAGVPRIGITSNLLGAKLAAGANTAAKPSATEYRLSVHANPGFGVWFEVGPVTPQEWSGAMLAVAGGEIKAHGVGPSGTLPEKCVLEYPLRGMELSLGEKKYTGWAVANKMTGDSSYFVKVDGVPSGLLFGPLAEGDEVELYRVDM